MAAPLAIIIVDGIFMTVIHSTGSVFFFKISSWEDKKRIQAIYCFKVTCKVTYNKKTTKSRALLMALAF